jgi:hypothetical protein
MEKIWVLALVFCMSCAGADPEDLGAEPQALVGRDLNVDFSGCTEFAGIGFIPAANARPLVPARYVLAGDATNALIVVRTARCKQALVDGLKSRSGTLSQIGIGLVGPDTTADINNYTLWYTTTDPLLSAGLLTRGVRAELDPSLRFAFEPSGAGGSLSVTDHPLFAPAYQLLGPVVTSTAASVTFTASWWRNSAAGTAHMRSTFPAIRFGGGTMTLTTDPHSALGRLIGGASLTFPALDSYNSFDSAHMVVHRSVP